MGDLVDLITRQENPVPFEQIKKYVETNIGDFKGYSLIKSRLFPKDKGELIITGPGSFGTKKEILRLTYDPMAQNPVWTDKSDYNNPLVQKIISAFENYKQTS